MTQRNTQPRRLWPSLTTALLLASLTGGAHAQNAIPPTAPTTITAPMTVTPRVDHTDLGRLHWQFAARTSVFPQMTFFDMVDHLHALVVHHLELVPGQALSADRPGVTVGPDMEPGALAAVVAKLRSVHMDIVSYQADNLGRSPAADRRTFAFAKVFGIKNIVCTPADVSLAALDALATEYGVNIVIRNGIKPAPHWNPAALAKTLAGRSAHVGVCADLADWKRSGLDPLKSLQALGPRVLEITLDDVDRRGQTVALGAGTVDLPPILKWLMDQKFVGIFAVGYEGGLGPDRENPWARSANTFADDLAAVAKTTGP